MKYSNGFITAWGTTTSASWSNGTSRTYTLPVTFTSNSYVLNMTKRNSPSYWAQVGYIITPVSTSTFSITSWSYSGTYTAPSQVIQWVATGY